MRLLTVTWGYGFAFTPGFMLSPASQVKFQAYFAAIQTAF
jgi:hypothetical protein